ncbi:MAG: ABC transporter substrate-binding protein [Anaerolineae bacterium]
MPTPTATSFPTFTPVVAAEPTPSVTPWDPTEPVTLTVWAPAELAIEAEDEGSSFRALQVSFAAEDPPVNVVIAPKSTEGAGSLISLLSATKPVVPERMPDIIAVEATDLERLVAEGLVMPLDALVPEDVWADTFPFAVEAATVDGTRVGLPFQADLTFMAYNSAMIEQPPVTWADVITGGAQYLLPMGDGDGSGADAFAARYLALGGAFEEDGHAYLDEGVTQQVLRALEEASQAGAISQRSRSVGTLEDGWAIYLTGEAAMSDVSAYLYQRDLGKLQRTRYAPMPSLDNRAVSLARTWVWAIVTPDAHRQEVAARFLVQAVQSAYMRDYCASRYLLPTRRSAVATEPADEEFAAFLKNQLESAEPYPRVESWPQVQAAVLRAVQDVLDGAASSERAAETAVAEVARLR